MRHRYETRGLVLSRTPSGEANAFVTLLTPELGLVRARAQGVRRSGAKLAASLATFAESSCVFVRGKEGWRIAGAMLEENWLARVASTSARARAARVSGLLLRLVGEQTQEAGLFSIITGFFAALSRLPEETHEAAEALAVLRVLAALGLDEGGIPGKASEFTPSLVGEIHKARMEYIARINRGIAASGL